MFSSCLGCLNLSKFLYIKVKYNLILFFLLWIFILTLPLFFYFSFNWLLISYPPLLPSSTPSKSPHLLNPVIAINCGRTHSLAITRTTTTINFHSEMASINVFGSPTSTEVARVLACLFEKNVEFQLIRVDGFKGAQRKKDYLKQQVIN